MMMMMMMMTLSSSIRIFFYCLHLLDWPHCVYVCVRVCVCVCYVCVLNTRPVKAPPTSIPRLGLAPPSHFFPWPIGSQDERQTAVLRDSADWLEPIRKKKKKKKTYIDTERLYLGNKPFPACLWLVLLNTQTDQSAPRKKPSMPPPRLPWPPPLPPSNSDLLC